MEYSVDDMVGIDYPFLHMAFDSTFVGLLDRVVAVCLHNTVRLETAVERAVVAAAGP